MIFLRLSKQRLSTFFLLGILIVVAYFVLETLFENFLFQKTSSKSSRNRGFNRVSNRLRRKSEFLINAVQSCYYDSDLVSNNALDKEWNWKASECLGKRQELFHLINGELQINQSVLKEKNLSLQRCEVKTVEWSSDDSYAIGEEINLGDLGKSQSLLSMTIKSDFIYIKCDLRIAPILLTERNHNEQRLSRNSDIPRIPEFESGTNNPDISSQNGNLQNLVPSLIGSLGLPDFRYGIQSNLGDRKPLKPGTTLFGPSSEISQMFPRRQESENARQTYNQFIVHVSEQEQTIDKLAPLLENKPAHAANVLILVLDSISQWSFDKNFNNTKKVFKDPVILHGFNVLGDSAIATLLPLLTGMKDEEVGDLKRRDKGGQYVGALPFIWNKFESLGYATLFAEDQPHLGTFQNHFMGFEEPPVDHYMRPFWLAAEDPNFELESNNCIGSKMKHEYILEYMRSFFVQYKDIPKFAFGFISEYDRTLRLDFDLRDFFESLKAVGVFNDTLTILLGDHGTNHGKMRESFGGMLNERLPLALISMPEALRSIKSEIVEKLKSNRHKLTTAFDLHATLLSLVDSSSQVDGEGNTRGISLFQKIPPERTCQSAEVSMHYCTCVKYQGLAADHRDATVGRTAKKIIEEINNILQNGDGFKRCQKLFLKKIISARFVLPNEIAELTNPNLGRQWLETNSSRDLPSGKFFLQVVLQATPGNALFEGTVGIGKTEESNAKDHSLDLNGISRINEYKGHSKCIERIVPSLSRFCFCSVDTE